RVAEPDTRVRERFGETKEQAAAVRITEAVEALDDLRADVRRELARIDTNAVADFGHIAQKRLLDVEIFRRHHAGRRVSEKPARGRDPRNREPGDDVGAIAEPAGFGSRSLNDQLSDI